MNILKSRANSRNLKQISGSYAEQDTLKLFFNWMRKGTTKSFCSEN